MAKEGDVVVNNWRLDKGSGEYRAAASKKRAKKEKLAPIILSGQSKEALNTVWITSGPDLNIVVPKRLLGNT